MTTRPTFATALAELARSLSANFASTVPAQPEDQLKAPVKALLETTLTRRTVARSEAQVAGLGGRPDFGRISPFLALDTTEGTYRVNPEHVVFVRTVG